MFNLLFTHCLISPQNLDRTSDLYGRSHKCRITSAVTSQGCSGSMALSVLVEIRKTVSGCSKDRVRPPTIGTVKSCNPSGYGGRRLPGPHHHNTSLSSSQPRIHITNTIEHHCSFIRSRNRTTFLHLLHPRASSHAKRRCLKKSPSSPVVLSSTALQKAHPVLAI